MDDQSSLKMPLAQLSATAIEKTYRTGPEAVSVLQGVNFSIQKGEFVSIVGQSGSGKSTLLHLIGLLDRPDIGEIRFDGKRIDDLGARQRDQIRNRVFGFVFQFYHLLPELTLLENVLLPMMIRYSTFEYWRRRGEFKERARQMIARVGLEHRLKHRPSQMSGGEMQRAAIARSLVSQPEVLLADEPTGNLDAETGAGILELLNSLNQDHGLSIIMVTHDNHLADQAHRIVRLKQGKLEQIELAAA